MQAGGSANNSIVHIGASAAISTIAIVLGQTIQIQLKVRNGDLQICQHTVVGFQRHTVAGNRHINSNRRLVSLVIAVLLLNALVGRIYGQLNGMSDLAAAALSGQYQIIGLTLRTLGSGCQVQHAVLQLGKHGVCGTVEGIAVAHLVAVSLCKHIAHFQLIQTAGLCSSCGRRAAFHGQAFCSTIDKQNVEIGAECFLNRNTIQNIITIGILYHHGMGGIGRPASVAVADIFARHIVVRPLHIRLEIQGHLCGTLRNRDGITRYLNRCGGAHVHPCKHTRLDLCHLFLIHISRKLRAIIYEHQVIGF